MNSLPREMMLRESSTIGLAHGRERRLLRMSPGFESQTGDVGSAGKDYTGYERRKLTPESQETYHREHEGKDLHHVSDAYVKEYRRHLDQLEQKVRSFNLALPQAEAEQARRELDQLRGKIDAIIRTIDSQLLANADRLEQRLLQVEKVLGKLDQAVKNLDRLGRESIQTYDEYSREYWHEKLLRDGRVVAFRASGYYLMDVPRHWMWRLGDWPASATPISDQRKRIRFTPSSLRSGDQVQIRMTWPFEQTVSATIELHGSEIHFVLPKPEGIQLKARLDLPPAEPRQKPVRSEPAPEKAPEKPEIDVTPDIALDGSRSETGRFQILPRMETQEFPSSRLKEETKIRVDEREMIPKTGDENIKEELNMFEDRGLLFSRLPGGELAVYSFKNFTKGPVDVTFTVGDQTITRRVICKTPPLKKTFDELIPPKPATVPDDLPRGVLRQSELKAVTPALEPLQSKPPKESTGEALRLLPRIDVFQSAQEKEGNARWETELRKMPSELRIVMLSGLEKLAEMRQKKQQDSAYAVYAPDDVPTIQRIVDAMTKELQEAILKSKGNDGKALLPYSIDGFEYFLGFVDNYPQGGYDRLSVHLEKPYTDEGKAECVLKRLPDQDLYSASRDELFAKSRFALDREYRNAKNKKEDQ